METDDLDAQQMCQIKALVVVCIQVLKFTYSNTHPVCRAVDSPSLSREGL